MRLLKAQNTNLRNIYGKGVKYDIDDQVIMDSNNVVLVPKGTTAQRPTSPAEGHLRYNTDNNEFEAYQGSSATWKRLAFKEPVTIRQQELGLGDATKTVFGPLDSQWDNDGGDYEDYAIPVAAQNMLVLVENVFQVSGAANNYTLEQNPDASELGAQVSDGSLVPGTEYYIVTPGTSDFTTVGAADNNANTVFTATDIDGGGDGTVRETGSYIQFTSAVDLNKPVVVLHNFDK
jgi:hypothetical protein